MYKMYVGLLDFVILGNLIRLNSTYGIQRSFDHNGIDSLFLYFYNELRRCSE